ncbi:MAG: PIG-L family deacetylase [Anaerolineae bacterium]|nr:PIG-L family deacetylase [Anaerolineae bacterium]
MALPVEAPLALPYTILIVVAHPDDIEFGSGGSAAAWTAQGAKVVYCIVTDGAGGSNSADMTPERLVEIRRQEQAAAAAKAGVSDVHYLGYRDGELVATVDLRRHIARLIRQIKPNRVVIMDPTAVLISAEGFDYINHPDHRAAGEAALYAVFPTSGSRLVMPELLDEGLEPHNVSELYLVMSDKPNIAVDISAVWDRKVAALLEHRSQVDESVVDEIRNWAVEAGKEAGVELAETYRVMRFGQ